MGLWSRLGSAFSAFQQKQTPEQWLSEFGYIGQTNSGVIVNQETAMRVATCMACVRICSEDVAKLPPHVWRKTKNGGRTEATDHYLYRLLRNPNNYQTWFEFCEMMQVALRMRGNAYAVVIRDGRGVPQQMIPVNPDHVAVYEAPGGEVFYNTVRASMHERAMLRGFPQMIPADDVFHLRWASSNGLVGKSPIGYARETLGLALGQEMHAANLIGKGARPSGYLSTKKKLSEEAYKRLKARWNNEQAGPANSGGTLVLEDEIMFNALTMTSVDLEFIAQSRLTDERICRIFRVIPFKVGITEGVSARNLEQVQLQHYTDTIHPDLVRWEQKFQVYFGLDADGVEVSFDETQLIRADLAARANAARVLGMSAVTTPDENRISFGMDPMGGAAGKLYIPVNMGELENVAKGAVVPGAGPGSDTTGAPAEGGDGDPAQLPPSG